MAHHYAGYAGAQRLQTASPPVLRAASPPVMPGIPPPRQLGTPPLIPPPGPPPLIQRHSSAMVPPMGLYKHPPVTYMHPGGQPAYHPNYHQRPPAPQYNFMPMSNMAVPPLPPVMVHFPVQTNFNNAGLPPAQSSHPVFCKRQGSASAPMKGRQPPLCGNCQLGHCTVHNTFIFNVDAALVGMAKENSSTQLMSLMANDKDYTAKVKRLYRKFAVLFKVYGPMEATHEKVINRFIQLSPEDRKVVLANGSLEDFLTSSEYFDTLDGQIVLKRDIPLLPTDAQEDEQQSSETDHGSIHLTHGFKPGKAVEGPQSGKAARDGTQYLGESTLEDEEEEECPLGEEEEYDLEEEYNSDYENWGDGLEYCMGGQDLYLQPVEYIDQGVEYDSQSSCYKQTRYTDVNALDEDESLDEGQTMFEQNGIAIGYAKANAKSTKVPPTRDADTIGENGQTIFEENAIKHGIDIQYEDGSRPIASLSDAASHEQNADEKFQQNALKHGIDIGPVADVSKSKDKVSTPDLEIHKNTDTPLPDICSKVVTDIGGSMETTVNSTENTKDTEEVGQETINEQRPLEIVDSSRPSHNGEQFKNIVEETRLALKSQNAIEPKAKAHKAVVESKSEKQSQNTIVELKFEQHPQNAVLEPQSENAVVELESEEQSKNTLEERKRVDQSNSLNVVTVENGPEVKKAEILPEKAASDHEHEKTEAEICAGSEYVRVNDDDRTRLENTVDQDSGVCDTPVLCPDGSKKKYTKSEERNGNQSILYKRAMSTNRSTDSQEICHSIVLDAIANSVDSVLVNQCTDERVENVERSNSSQQTACTQSKLEPSEVLGNLSNKIDKEISEITNDEDKIAMAADLKQYTPSKSKENSMEIGLKNSSPLTMDPMGNLHAKQSVNCEGNSCQSKQTGEASQTKPNRSTNNSPTYRWSQNLATKSAAKLNPQNLAAKSIAKLSPHAVEFTPSQASCVTSGNGGATSAICVIPEVPVPLYSVTAVRPDFQHSASVDRIDPMPVCKDSISRCTSRDVGTITEDLHRTKKTTTSICYEKQTQTGHHYEDLLKRAIKAEESVVRLQGHLLMMLLRRQLQQAQYSHDHTSGSGEAGSASQMSEVMRLRQECKRLQEQVASHVQTIQAGTLLDELTKLEVSMVVSGVQRKVSMQENELGQFPNPMQTVHREAATPPPNLKTSPKEARLFEPLKSSSGASCVSKPFVDSTKCLVPEKLSAIPSTKGVDPAITVVFDKSTPLANNVSVPVISFQEPIESTKCIIPDKSLFPNGVKGPKVDSAKAVIPVQLAVFTDFKGPVNFAKADKCATFTDLKGPIDSAKAVIPDKFASFSGFKVPGKAAIPESTMFTDFKGAVDSTKAVIPDKSTTAASFKESAVFTDFKGSVEPSKSMAPDEPVTVPSSSTPQTRQPPGLESMKDFAIEKEMPIHARKASVELPPSREISAPFGRPRPSTEPKEAGPSTNEKQTVMPKPPGHLSDSSRNSTPDPVEPVGNATKPGAQNVHASGVARSSSPDAGAAAQMKSDAAANVDNLFLLQEVRSRILNKYPFLSSQSETLEALVTQQTSLLQYYIAIGVTCPPASTGVPSQGGSGQTSVTPPTLGPAAPSQTVRGQPAPGPATRMRATGEAGLGQAALGQTHRGPTVERQTFMRPAAQGQTAVTSSPISQTVVGKRFPNPTVTGQHPMMQPAHYPVQAQISRTKLVPKQTSQPRTVPFNPLQAASCPTALGQTKTGSGMSPCRPDWPAGHCAGQVLPGQANPIQEHLGQTKPIPILTPQILGSQPHLSYSRSLSPARGQSASSNIPKNEITVCRSDGKSAVFQKPVMNAGIHRTEGRKASLVAKRSQPHPPAPAAPPPTNSPEGENWEVDDFPELTTCGYDPRREISYGNKTEPQLAASVTSSSVPQKPSIPGLTGAMLQGVKTTTARSRSVSGPVIVGKPAEAKEDKNMVEAKNKAADNTNPLVAKEIPCSEKPEGGKEGTKAWGIEHITEGPEDVQEEWTQVSKRKRKESCSQGQLSRPPLTKPSFRALNASQSGRPSAPSRSIPGLTYAYTNPGQKTSTSERLLDLVKQHIPQLSRQNALAAVKKVRRERGGVLTGVNMGQIVEHVKTIVSRKMTSCGVPTHSSSTEEDVCVICCDELSEGVTKKLECGHEFHEHCIHRWIYGRERTCPTCRQHTLFPEEFPRLSKD